MATKDDSGVSATDQAKGLSSALSALQDTIRQLTEGIVKLEDENKQLKYRNKVLQKRANQGGTRPSLVLNMSTEELIETNVKQQAKSKKTQDLEKSKSSANLSIPSGGTEQSGVTNSSGASPSNDQSAAADEFGQYLNATEIKQVTNEMSKCKNTDQKLQTVWSNVAKFVRKSQPTKAMGVLAVFGKEYDINYRNMEEDGMTLVHVTCHGENGNVLVLRFILTYFANVDVWLRTKSGQMTALDLAGIYQHKDCVDALLGYSWKNDYISNEQKDAYGYSEEWQEYNNLMIMFDDYLKKDQRNNPAGGIVLYEKLIQSLEDCLIRLIEDKKAFPMQIFYWVWFSHKNTIRAKKAEYFEQLKKYKAQKASQKKQASGTSAQKGGTAKHVRTASTGVVVKPVKVKYSMTDSKLWKALKDQLTRVFEWENVSQAPSDWFWFQYNFLNNPMWLDFLDEKLEDGKSNEKDKDNKDSKDSKETKDKDKGKEKDKEKDKDKDKEKEKETKTEESDSGSDIRVFEELHSLAKQQLDRGSEWLESRMKELIQKSGLSLESWKKIIEYQYKTSTYRGKKQWRQDCIPEGLQCEIEPNQLEQVSLLSKSYDYDAKFEYDYNNYVSQLCIRAQSLNEPFQNAIQSLFKDHIDSKKAAYIAGPVKTVRQVREKAYNLFRDCDFPTSAQVLDMVRCSLVYSSVDELWNGVSLLTSLENSNTENETDSKTDINTNISIMRCVNQFATMKKGLHFRETIGEAGLPIPTANVELRFNVIACVQQKDDEAIGIVGEIVLTVKPIADFQKKSAELTQVIKLKEKIDKCVETKFSFDQRLRIAGTDGRSLAPLFVKEPHRFTEECIRAKDAYGKSLLTRFLQDKDTPADLIRNYIQCIPKSLMPEVWKAKIDAGKTPIMLLVQNHNAPVIKAALECIPNYLRDELFKEKNNDGWTPMMLAARYQTYPNLKAMIPFVPKDPSLWQNASNKGLHVLHCICQNESEDAHLSLTDLLEAMPEHIRGKLANTPNKDGKKAAYYASLKANQKNGTSAVLAKQFPSDSEAPKS